MRTFTITDRRTKVSRVICRRHGLSKALPALLQG